MSQDLAWCRAQPSDPRFGSSEHVHWCQLQRRGHTTPLLLTGEAYHTADHLHVQQSRTARLGRSMFLTACCVHRSYTATSRLKAFQNVQHVNAFWSYSVKGVCYVNEQASGFYVVEVKRALPVVSTIASWQVCCIWCRNYIVPMDLEFFMPPEKIPQALKVLDVDNDGKISLSDMRDAVIQVALSSAQVSLSLQRIVQLPINPAVVPSSQCYILCMQPIWQG